MYEIMIGDYRDIVKDYMKTAVTRNYSEECISNLMDFVSGSILSVDTLEEFYSATLDPLAEEANTELSTKAIAILPAIPNPNPRIMGLVPEFRGTMRMSEHHWAEATEDFFEAFNIYDHAWDHIRRVRCLKYLVLAHMLMESDLNPFHFQEMQGYENSPEFLHMGNLIAGYQRDDIFEFEMFLQTNELMNDKIIQRYIKDVRKKIRTRLLLNLIQPYENESTTIAFISEVLVECAQA